MHTARPKSVGWRAEGLGATENAGTHRPWRPMDRSYGRCRAAPRHARPRASPRSPRSCADVPRLASNPFIPTAARAPRHLVMQPSGTRPRMPQVGRPPAAYTPACPLPSPRWLYSISSTTKDPHQMSIAVREIARPDPAAVKRWANMESPPFTRRRAAPACLPRTCGRSTGHFARRPRGYRADAARRQLDDPRRCRARETG